MRYILIISVLSLMAAACTNTPEAAQKKEVAMATDSTGIADALHGFFKWYEDNNERIGAINFVDDSGKHLTLNEAKLDEFLAEMTKSGFVSAAFSADEKRFYQACSKFWANEPIDEVPTGLGADRYFCAQDFVGPYSEGKVTSVVKNEQADAVLTLAENTTFNFKMAKENGRWLLVKLGCNMGVEY